MAQQKYKITTFKDRYTGRTIALYTHKSNPALNKAYVDVDRELTRITHTNHFSDLHVHMYHPTPEERQLLTRVEVHKETADRVRRHLAQTHTPSKKEPEKKIHEQEREEENNMKGVNDFALTYIIGVSCIFGLLIVGQLNPEVSSISYATAIVLGLMYLFAVIPVDT